MPTAAHDINWTELRARAKLVMENAYSSSTKVGVAGLMEDGTVVVGCNVSNISPAMTLCAECGMISSIYSQGLGHLKLIAFTCTSNVGSMMPCGRCRQLLAEHGGKELLVDTSKGIKRMEELLPGGFFLDEEDGWNYAS